ncbi:TIGR02678 family protein [Micromonospora avicenniae]|uniref:TIGR02678 family protein n=1 Tax=Micromonospora avicenniae TaxID=1198245 RepID=UPI00342B007E
MSSMGLDSGTGSWAKQRRQHPEVGFEIAAVLRRLMVQPWLISGRDDEAIGAVRRNEEKVRDPIGKLGWVLIVERDFVRLRKSPPQRRHAWAATGPKPLTCSWFFLLVAAAEAMPPKVGIGHLVSGARAAAAETGLPAPNDQAERYAIIGALKMLHERGVVERLDGDLDEYLTNNDAPVLLAVHHHRLAHVIANFGSGDPSVDPQAWLEQVEREADPARRMRRKLIDDTVVYTSDLDPAEADWLSRRVRSDDGLPLAATFGLHLERRAEGAAFVVPDGAFRSRKELGDRPFPAGGTVAHAALLLCDVASADGILDPGRPGWRGLSAEDLLDRLAGFAAVFGDGRGWAAEDVADLPGLAAKVQGLLDGIALLRVDDDGTWWFSPATGRWEPPPPSPTKTAPVPRPGPAENAGDLFDHAAPIDLFNH